MSVDKYQQPTEELKFNDPRYEVALGARDLDEESDAAAGKDAKDAKSRPKKKTSERGGDEGCSSSD